MKTSSELYNQSQKLENALAEYKKNNNFMELEKTLLELVHIYEWLNFYKEDEFLEKSIDTSMKLAEFYLNNNDSNNALNFYVNAIECYDEIIQRDRNNDKILNSYIEDLKSVYSKFKELASQVGIEDRIKFEYPRIRKYIEK